MMNTASLQKTAAWAISSQGQPVTLTPPGGTYDVSTSTFTGTGSTVATVGVLMPLSRGLTHMPGTDIQSGDMQLLLPGSIAQPPVDSRALIGGKTYTITEVNPVGVAGSPLYFDCIARVPQ